MSRAITHRAALASWIAAPLLLLAGCSGPAEISDRTFVGKWKSSRLTTPIQLYENGEWEIRRADGTVLQYGVWQYKDKTLLWSYKQGDDIGHDANAVLSATAREFRVREQDRTTTTFTRLD